MTSGATRKTKRHVRSLSDADLRQLVETLGPEIRRAHSLFECALQELRKREKTEAKAA